MEQEVEKVKRLVPGKLYRVVGQIDHAWVKGENGEKYRASSWHDECWWVEHWPVLAGIVFLFLWDKETVGGAGNRTQYPSGDRHHYFLHGEKVVRIVLPLYPAKELFLHAVKKWPDHIFEEVGEATSSPQCSSPENSIEPKSL